MIHRNAPSKRNKVIGKVNLVCDKPCKLERREQTIRVTYQGFDPTIDRQIIDSIKDDANEWEFKWYAQGYNFKTGIRDICFDYVQKETNNAHLR